MAPQATISALGPGGVVGGDGGENRRADRSGVRHRGSVGVDLCGLRVRAPYCSRTAHSVEREFGCRDGTERSGGRDTTGRSRSRKFAGRAGATPWSGNRWAGAGSRAAQSWWWRRRCACSADQDPNARFHAGVSHTRGRQLDGSSDQQTVRRVRDGDDSCEAGRHVHTMRVRQRLHRWRTGSPITWRRQVLLHCGAGWHGGVADRIEALRARGFRWGHG